MNNTLLFFVVTRDPFISKIQLIKNKNIGPNFMLHNYINVQKM